MIRLKLIFIQLITCLSAAAEVSFNRQVRPILSNNCYFCHGTDANHRKGDRRLDTSEGAMAEILGVRAIVPFQPDDSELIARILSEDPTEVMPPPKSNKSITVAEKEILREWISEGAKYEPHWAFLPPTRPPVPAGINAIDHFVEKLLVANQLHFSAPAEKGVLLRRLSLDLTGLPPSLAEVDAFKKESAPDAYLRQVTRLLASPRYGERMAMDWLDVARYADTNGYQGDANRMNWPWRDWVVKAFNDNMRFDQFTREQLAGDLLKNPTQDQLVATAFNRNHMINAEGGTIAEENRTKAVFDRTETTSGAWLGLTMQCCQCHDHKFDPLKQSDYYSMYALFNQLSETGAPDKNFGQKAYSDQYDKLYTVESPYVALATAQSTAEMAAAVDVPKQASDQLVARKAEFYPAFEKWVKEMRNDAPLMEERLHDPLDKTAVQLANLDNFFEQNVQRLLKVYLELDGNAEFKSLKQAMNKARISEELVQETIPLVMIMRDDRPRDTHILERGNYETLGAKVEPGIPHFLPQLPAGAKADRLALANWLTTPEQPLMPRVIMNRLWQLFFGRGLVKTADDFGLQGDLPSHPELLDWLAVEFRESGWNTQHMIKLILTSRTYQQSATFSSEHSAKNPGNIWLAHGPRSRLDSRFIRDQALSLAGLLVEKSGGSPVNPYQPAGVWEGISFDKIRYFQGKGEDLHRRSLYTFWRRSVAPTNFFDAPSRQFCALQPNRTNTPLHALTTLNDITYVEAARVMATQLTPLNDDDSKIRYLIRSATARDPNAAELSSMRALLSDAREHFSTNLDEASKLVSNGEAQSITMNDTAEHAVWMTVCLLVLNLDETLTK